MAYDPTTLNGQVRLLIGDTDYANLLFTDAEITAFLGMGSNNIYAAAAVSYGVILRSYALRAKKIAREGYETEKYAIDAMLKLKQDLEQQALTIDGLVTMDFSVTDEHFESWKPEWRDALERWFY